MTKTNLRRIQHNHNLVVYKYKLTYSDEKQFQKFTLWKKTYPRHEQSDSRVRRRCLCSIRSFIRRTLPGSVSGFLYPSDPNDVFWAHRSDFMPMLRVPGNDFLLVFLEQDSFLTFARIDRPGPVVFEGTVDRVPVPPLLRSDVSKMLAEPEYIKFNFEVCKMCMKNSRNLVTPGK